MKKQQPEDNSKTALIAWVNDLLETDLRHVEQLCTGAVYCQILDVVYPDQIPLKKINWKPKLESEYLANLKLFYDTLKKCNLEKNVDIYKLLEMKFAEHYELLIWLKKFVTNTCHTSKHYKASERRDGAEIEFPNFKEKAMPHKGKEPAPRVPKVQRDASRSPSPAPTGRHADLPRKPPVPKREDLFQNKNDHTEKKKINEAPLENANDKFQTPYNQVPRSEAKEVKNDEIKPAKPDITPIKYPSIGDFGLLANKKKQEQIAIKMMNMKLDDPIQAKQSQKDKQNTVNSNNVIGQSKDKPSSAVATSIFSTPIKPSSIPSPSAPSQEGNDQRRSLLQMIPQMFMTLVRSPFKKSPKP